MQTSEQCNEIFEALSKAQGAYNLAKRSKFNENLNYPYATYSDVIEVIREPFSANGLGFFQWEIPTGDTNLIVCGQRIFHKSGQWIESESCAIIGRKVGGQIVVDTQARSSALTTAQRRGLSALAGVASEHDDDSEAAVKAGQGQPRTASSRPPTGEKGKCPVCNVTPATAGRHHRPDCENYVAPPGQKAEAAA